MAPRAMPDAKKSGTAVLIGLPKRVDRVQSSDSPANFAALTPSTSRFSSSERKVRMRRHHREVLLVGSAAPRSMASPCPTSHAPRRRPWPAPPVARVRWRTGYSHSGPFSRPFVHAISSPRKIVMAAISVKRFSCLLISPTKGSNDGNGGRQFASHWSPQVKHPQWVSRNRTDGKSRATGSNRSRNS